MVAEAFQLHAQGRRLTLSNHLGLGGGVGGWVTSGGEADHVSVWATFPGTDSKEFTRG